MTKFSFMTLVGLAVLTTAAQAQTLTSRFSQQNFNAVYGAGASVFTPNGNVTDSNLVASDSEFQQFNDSQSGSVSSGPWSASVTLEQVHSYTVTGSLSNFTSIAASGQTFVAAAASGAGLANMVAANQGNTLELYFTLTSSTLANLRGNVSLVPDGQNLSAYVTLQKFDGFVWQNIFNSLFLPGQEGTFNNNYNLASGSYRVIGLSAGNAFAGVRPSQTNTWNYNLQVVPEPGTMAALGLGALALVRRKRKA